MTSSTGAAASAPPTAVSMDDAIAYYRRVGSATGWAALIMACIAVLLSTLQASIYNYVRFRTAGSGEHNIVTETAKIILVVVTQTCIVIPRVTLLDSVSVLCLRLGNLLSQYHSYEDMDELVEAYEETVEEGAQFVCVRHPPIAFPGRRPPRRRRRLRPKAVPRRGGCFHLEKTVDYYGRLRSVFVVLLVVEYSILTALTVAISAYTKLNVKATEDLQRAATFYLGSEQYYLQLLATPNVSQAELAHVEADIAFYSREMEAFDELERGYAFVLVVLHGVQAFTVMLASFLPFKRMSDSCQRIVATALALMASPSSRLHREALASEIAEIQCCFAVEYAECPEDSLAAAL